MRLRSHTIWRALGLLVMVGVAPLLPHELTVAAWGVVWQTSATEIAGAWLVLWPDLQKLVRLLAPMLVRHLLMRGKP